jgi:surfeit locus 1 family protein
VHVVTPLVIAEDRAVLVDRGWLYSDDAATAHPERLPEPGVQRVVGIAEPLKGGRAGAALTVIRSDSASLLSARWLDRDSLAGRFPYALAEFSVRQLPAEGVPAQPLRTNPTPYDEMMHLSYAIQWFSFATILVVGSLILGLRRKRPADLVPPVPGRAT